MSIRWVRRNNKETWKMLWKQQGKIRLERWMHFNPEHNHNPISTNNALLQSQVVWGYLEQQTPTLPP